MTWELNRVILLDDTVEKQNEGRDEEQRRYDQDGKSGPKYMS